jgi:hypothetical protein
MMFVYLMYSSSEIFLYVLPAVGAIVGRSIFIVVVGGNVVVVVVVVVHVVRKEAEINKHHYT